MPGDAWRCRKSLNAASLRLGKAKPRKLGFLDAWIFGFWPSVQDQRPDPDRTEFGPRPVRSIFWDRRSRFGPVDRPLVGLWTSLEEREKGRERERKLEINRNFIL